MDEVLLAGICAGGFAIGDATSSSGTSAVIDTIPWTACRPSVVTRVIVCPACRIGVTPRQLMMAVTPGWPRRQRLAFSFSSTEPTCPRTMTWP